MVATHRAPDGGDVSFTVGILTTERRGALLEETLASIRTAAENYDAPVEVLLGGREITRMAEALDDSFDLPIDVVETDGTLADGRQRLIEESPTEWLLFVDNDCVVSPDIFEVYAGRLADAEEPVGAVFGYTRFEGDAPPAFEACRYTPYIHPFQIVACYDTVEWAPTANALFSTSAVQDVGGFSRGLPSPSGSDVDIGIRLSEAGYRGVAAPDAEIAHTTETWSSFTGNCRRFFDFGRSEAWLVSQFPNRRESSALVPGLAALGVLSLLLGPLLLLSVGGARLVERFLRWVADGRRTTLQSYVIADLYRLVDAAGYVSQVLRSEKVSPLALRWRFAFYRRPYVQEAIWEEGPRRRP